ncbi:MAG: membrane protein insertase YidC, partial [Candidatus Sumerlaeota bacterium]|nr:membrane protein insertase YidC [Candidatus Sumerlaeota bacterium]
METQRWLTFFLIVLLSYFVFQKFFIQPTSDQQRRAAEAASQASQAASQGAEGLAAASRPVSAPAVGSRVSSAPAEEETPGRSLVVENENCRIEFSTRGGVPVSWRVVDPAFTANHPGATGGPGVMSDEAASHTLELIPPIPDAPDREYPFEVSIREANRVGGNLDSINRRVFEVARESRQDGAHVLRFTSPVLPEGLQLVKEFVIPPTGYLTEVAIRWINHSGQTFQFEENAHGPGLVWAGGLGGVDASSAKSKSYFARVAAVWLSGGVRNWEYQDQMEVGKTRDFSGSVQWAGIVHRYFLAAIIPLQPGAVAVQVNAKPRNTPAGLTKKGQSSQGIEVFSPPLALKPGESVEFTYQAFVGPTSSHVLRAVDKNLDEVLFFMSWGWFRAVCILMMDLLLWLRKFTPDYGWAIIALTFLLRLVTQPLVQFSLKANARFVKAQQKLKPELDEIAKKHKDNPQKRNEETWKLYKKHNVNPLGMLEGCFWMLIQMPILMAMYRLLDASIELHGATFLWIKDLSLPDNLFTLPAWFPLIQSFNLLP